MRKIILSSSLILIIIVVFSSTYFGSALLQEENTMQILFSISKLHLTSTDAVLVEGQDTNHTFVSKTKDDIEKIIVEKLSEDKWSYKEQMGSAYIFTKGDDTKTISTRLFTKHYFLWNIPTQ